MRTTIFIDLDDTLVDTFGLLIAPLEREAARAICQSGIIPLAEKRLAAFLLDLRRRDPASLRDRLRALAQTLTVADPDRILAVRDRVFADFSVEALRISAKTVAILKFLAPDYRLVLVTEGRSAIQTEKLRHLDLADLFDDILIVDPATGATKASALRRYLRAHAIAAAHAIVVGNRLDREIAAANTLGITAIWLRSGEGSEMQPHDIPVFPDLVIEAFAALPEAIRILAARH